MNELIEAINYRVPVLLSGESGTGKSSLVKKLHRASSKSSRPLVLVPLTGVKEELMEAELFGHKKGSFTGAINNRLGLVEAAADGVLFFDEIAELSLSAQAKLLFLLEEREFLPVGASTPIKTAASFIFATHQNLKSRVEQGAFREDLYYRIHSLEYKLTPFREQSLESRKDAVRRIWSEVAKDVAVITPVPEEFFNYLADHPMPGNYRQLKHEIYKALIYLKCNDCNFECLRSLMKVKASEVPHFTSRTYQQALAQFEESFLREQLRIRGGRVNQTAKEVEISKTTLIAKARKYGINTWHLKSIAAAR
jgi:DNA-binding NtrC family response regulator